jgi:spore coat protein U-like protein
MLTDKLIMGTTVRGIIVLAIAWVCVAGLGFAGTATGSLTVSATVSAACQVSSVANISFGSYDPLSSSPKDADGTMVFRCVKGTSYKTYISGVRTMTGNGNDLSFQLFSDSGRTSVFAGSNTGSSITATSNNPVAQNIYGRIAAGQDVPASSYTTTLIATVEY